jgi:hypothetical protein
VSAFSTKALPKRTSLPLDDVYQRQEHFTQSLNETPRSIIPHPSAFSEQIRNFSGSQRSRPLSRQRSLSTVEPLMLQPKEMLSSVESPASEENTTKISGQMESAALRAPRRFVSEILERIDSFEQLQSEPEIQAVGQEILRRISHFSRQIHQPSSSIELISPLQTENVFARLEAHAANRGRRRLLRLNAPTALPVQTAPTVEPEVSNLQASQTIGGWGVSKKHSERVPSARPNPVQVAAARRQILGSPRKVGSVLPRVLALQPQVRGSAQKSRMYIGGEGSQQ